MPKLSTYAMIKALSKLTGIGMPETRMIAYKVMANLIHPRLTAP